MNLSGAIEAGPGPSGSVVFVGDQPELPNEAFDRGGAVVVVWEGSTSAMPDATVHDCFCALARTLAAGSRVIFRYTTRIVPGERFVLCIDPEDLADYLGVRGFGLVSDVADSEPFRIAVARRRADRKSCCGLRQAAGAVPAATFPAT